MSRAYNFLVVTIETYLGDEAEAFWLEYRRLARLDVRDRKASIKLRQLKVAYTKIVEWQQRRDEPGADVQIKRYEEKRSKCQAWLEKYGYSETED